ncbi:WD40-repeat-containing domain protein [Blastocladiella britannica]|nr:WD40-repeat-containing domain protein [Blastocladiella britannica]
MTIPGPGHLAQPTNAGYASAPAGGAVGGGVRRLSLLDSQHADLIHDLQFDFYGTRLCTASSDMRLKVWDWHPESQAWTLNDAWRAHEASIVRVAFGHPDYGRLIASCGYDRTVRIWEEVGDAFPRGSGKRWVERARLVDSRASVTDLAFAPAHLGLKLATASVDGTVRIYEAMDVVNLAHWTLMDEVDVVPDAREADGALCLSWCKAKHMPAFPAPPAAPSATGSPQTFATNTPALNGSGGTTSSPRGPVRTGTAGTAASGDGAAAMDGTPMITPSAMIAVGCGREHSARIYYHDAGRNRWFPGDVLPGHTDLIHDISWAPSMGRSFQLVATACRDSVVRIFRIAAGHSPLLLAASNPLSPYANTTPPSPAPHMLSSRTAAGMGSGGSAVPPRFPPGSFPAHALSALAAVNEAAGSGGAGFRGGGSTSGATNGAMGMMWGAAAAGTAAAAASAGGRSEDGALGGGGAGPSADPHGSNDAAAVAAAVAAMPRHISCVAALGDHEAQVWRVQWNITGTVLSSAGDDGAVRLWRAAGGAGTRWACVAVVKVDKPEN